MLRRAFWMFGWAIVLVAPVVFIAEFVIAEYNFPPVPWWQWGVLGAAAILVAFARPKDEVVMHHLPH
ncbi:MAG: hypothetical protein JJE51_05525 [Thermoanaerobaculia bacterium]|nr:hypothetical protein [Thermoanaerobaculia bacterium]